jgi:hypothetical protein
MPKHLKMRASTGGPKGVPKGPQVEQILFHFFDAVLLKSLKFFFAF